MDKAEHSSYGVRWPDQLAGPWHLTFHWASIGGRMECVGLDVRSFRESRDKVGKVVRKPVRERLQRLDATTWRQIHPLIGNAREEWASEWLPSLAAGALAGLSTEQRQAASDAATAFERPGRRRRLDLAHFEQVARIYQDAVREGSLAPNVAVRDAFPWASPTAVRKWVARCRSDELGLLPPTTERRASRPEDIEPPKRRRGARRHG